MSNAKKYWYWYIGCLGLSLLLVALFVFYFKGNPIEIVQSKNIDYFNNRVNILTSPAVNVAVPDTKKSTDNLIELYNLYYKGVHGKYNNKGNYIKGIEPDYQKAIMYLNQAIASTEEMSRKQVELVIKLAKIYHYGMHKLNEDLDTARDIYSMLLSKHKSIRNIDSDLLTEIITCVQDIDQTKAYKWLNLKKPNAATDTVTNVVTTPQLDIDIDTYNMNVALLRMYDNQNRPPEGRNLVQVNDTVVDARQLENSGQNTHDSAVVGTIKDSLKKLVDTTKIQNVDTSYHEIKSLIDKMPKSDKKDNALKSLEAVNNGTSAHSIGYSQKEVLNIVWSRIKDKHSDSMNNMMDTLVYELANMQEHDTTVCSTGRITRLVDTLNVVDDAVSIKPMYALNEEMMNKAASIREKTLSNYGNERDLLERGTSSIQNEYEHLLKETIKSELKKDYVDSGILTELKFASEINKWIDEI